MMQSECVTDHRASTVLCVPERALARPPDHHLEHRSNRPPVDVQQAVKARATAAGMSLNEVERRARWSTGALSRALRANMTLASLERIAAALECTGWELLRDAAAESTSPNGSITRP
jgi:hypothetical protein